MKEYKFKLDQRVYFKLGENLPFGWAHVSGAFGFVIIIEPEIPIKDYPFTHIYLIDTQIVEPPTL
jgi:hypothetical protein